MNVIRDIKFANEVSLPTGKYKGGIYNSTNVNSLRNENFKTALWATSSVDGITPVQLYCDVDGKLLINSQ
jgi:hypothetical protein